MELSLASFVFWIVALAGVMVAAFSLASRWLAWKAEKAGRAHRVMCRLCMHTFENEAQGKIVICPCCGAANEKRHR